MTRAFAILVLLGCGARAGLPVEEREDASTDASVSDASLLDASLPDTRAPDTARPPPPPRCMALPESGQVRGNIPGFDIDFPFVVAGIESFGSHSCPRLFIRAGDSPTFDGAYLEIEVHYSRDEGFVRGRREGFLSVYPEGRSTAEPWFEEIVVEVLRVDGLEDTPLPPEDWRAVAFVDYHDATTDLVGEIIEAPYCNDFAICI